MSSRFSFELATQCKMPCCRCGQWKREMVWWEATFECVTAFCDDIALPDVDVTYIEFLRRYDGRVCHISRALFKIVFFFNISRPSRVQVQISKPPLDQIRILLETCGLVGPSGTLGTPWGGQKRHFEVLQNYDENLFSCHK